MDAKTIKQIKARLAEMKQAAASLTYDLGLPREATYDVLAMMHGEEPTPLAASPQTNQTGESRNAVNETRLKEQIYQLSEGFLATRMKEQLPTFQAIWERLSMLSFETLEGFRQSGAGSQGLGFAESQTLLPVISVISWAVVNYQQWSQTNTSEQIHIKIADEAEARGCPRALSNAIALYLREKLTSN